MDEVFHEEFTATDPEAVTELFAQLGVRFSFDPAGSGFSYREHRAADQHLTVSRLGLGSAFSTWGDTSVFGVVDVHGSRYDWQLGDEAGSGIGTPVLFRPGHPALIVADALRTTNVYLTPGVLQEVSDTVYGTENLPVAFASSRPITPRLGRYWSSLARFAQETVESGAFDAPLVRAELTRHLAVGMLECFPLTGDRETRSLSMAAQIRRYRRAVQFIDDHAHEPITVEDAARAADTATDTLTRAFRANHPHQLTPAQYLRQARLAGAHAELLHAHPTAGDTVREIAARWGFAHPGRFAAAYRQAYGVLPSTTLDR
jgi:AraC-like DNA-binding protein